MNKNDQLFSKSSLQTKIRPLLVGSQKPNFNLFQDYAALHFFRNLKKKDTLLFLLLQNSVFTKKLPIPMSDVSPADLPQEIISDILLRLPLKSIGRSRCVSKPWLSLLTSYDFSKAHLTHHTHLFAQEQKLLLWSYYGGSIFSLTLHLGGNHLKRLDFFDENMLTLVDSCNGLVLVVTTKGDKYLINCLTEEYVKLPPSTYPLCPHLSFRKFGFGYDCLNDDYKMVYISQCNNHAVTGDIVCADNFVVIYSLKMRSWKRLGTPFYGHVLPNHYSCVFINGALYWIAWKSSYKDSVVIVAFDLSSETFKEIPAPVDNATLVVKASLKVFDGCLGIVVKQCTAEKTKIWLMKSYSSVESWTELVVDFTPICFHKDRFLFPDWRAGVFNWYCLKDGRVELCLVNDGRHSFSDGITYNESLVSPHFNHHNC